MKLPALALFAMGVVASALQAQTAATLPNLSTAYTQTVVSTYSQTCDTTCHNQTGDPLVAALSNTSDSDTKIDDSGNLLFDAGVADSNGVSYSKGLWLLHPDGTSQTFSESYPAFACSQPNANSAIISGSLLMRTYFNTVVKAFFAVTYTSQATYSFSKSNAGICTTQSINGSYTLTTNTVFALVRIDKVPPPQSSF
jgi:hypothetical protein